MLPMMQKWQDGFNNFRTGQNRMFIFGGQVGADKTPRVNTVSVLMVSKLVLGWCLMRRAGWGGCLGYSISLTECTEMLRRRKHFHVRLAYARRPHTMKGPPVLLIMTPEYARKSACRCSTYKTTQGFKHFEIHSTSDLKGLSYAARFISVGVTIQSRSTDATDGKDKHRWNM